jgi:hypothetical protein
MGDDVLEEIGQELSEKQEIIEKPKRELHKFTKEDRIAGGKARWENARNRAAEGLQEAVDEILAEMDNGILPKKTNTPAEAWKHIMKKATKEFMHSTSLKGMSDMASFIGKSTGMTRDVQAGDKEPAALPMLEGLEDARIILQVFYGNMPEIEERLDADIDIIDAELYDIIE